MEKFEDAKDTMVYLKW